MFAVASTDALSLAEPSLLKKGPSSIPSCLDLVASPTGCSWSPDNGILYLASANKIHQYDPINNSTKDLHVTEDGKTIRHIVSKDKDTVVFSVNDKVHILECGEILQTFESHRGEITSLSLSNDYTLLSSSSSGATHVHNLTTGVQTTLRGLNLAGQPINTAVFHPHSRTRLLIGVGKQLLVYDVTRPSGPAKTIAMADSSSGDIIAVACSPFSKTLIAAATSEGYIGLIDLEKEKSLFRTLNLKVTLNTLDFSPEGASIYLGTDNGKLLIVDLRALDKPPKTVVISPSGFPITTMSTQRKVKSTDSLTRTPVAPGAQNMKPSGSHLSARRAASSAQVTTSRTTPSVVTTPAKAREVKARLGASPAVRKVSTLKEGSPTKKSSSTDLKKVLSPVRDPHGNSGGAGDISIQLDDFSGLGRGKLTTTPVKLKAKASTDTLQSRPTPSPRAGRGTTSASTGKAKASPTTTIIENPRRTRTLPATSTVSARTRKTSNPALPESLSANEHPAVPKKSPLRRARTTSSASRAETISGVSSKSSTTAGVGSSRSSSSASRLGTSASRTTTKSSSPVPPVPKIPGNVKARSCTASPEFPDMQTQPTTPVPAQKRKKGTFDLLGLGTPEVERWINAGQGGDRVGKNKGKGKSVGFKDDEGDGDEEAHNHERSLSLQISPRRPSHGVSTSGSGSTQSSWATSPYPANPTHTSSGSSAHELLKTIVQDVMYDFQRETKAEMTGLHLDLVRMGRTWKSELRVLMDEYVGDLRDLREENQRLRLENERLRKGAF